MRILLSNDDGILAPGIAALRDALSALGEVSVVAPEEPQSATAHGITFPGPVAARRIHVQDAFFGWSVDGRPADCVKLGVTELLEHKPDLVVSGINDGANASLNVLYSGTVAAAAEGALMGYPAVAVSMERGVERDFRRGARIAVPIIRRLIEGGLRRGELINVNIPDLKPGIPRGVRVVPQATRTMETRFVRHSAPDGRDYYWLCGAEVWHGDPCDSDLDAIMDGYVAITPLHFDMTRYEMMKDLQQWNWPDLCQ
jgi:5'-nucleotidase